MSPSLTRAELLRLAGRGGEIRRRPSFAPKADRPRESEPSLTPTRAGLTPLALAPLFRDGAPLGIVTYLYACPRGIAYARWADGRAQVPVVWLLEPPPGLPLTG
jgi:hypothetical protein